MKFKNIFIFLCSIIIKINCLHAGLFHYYSKADQNAGLSFEESLLAKTKSESSRQDKINLWFTAVKKHNLDTIKRLSNIVDVNVQDAQGTTALMIASMNNDENIVKFLLQLPAININVQDDKGLTALMHAVIENHQYIVRTFLDSSKARDININMQDDEGNTALMQSPTRQSEQICRSLLSIDKIDVNIQNDEGNTVLILAIEQRCHPTTIKKLLSASNIDVNIKNQKGATALSHAVYLGYQDIVSLLLQEPDIIIAGKDASIGQKDIVLPYPLVQTKIYELTDLAFKSIDLNNIEQLKKIIAQIGVDNCVDKYGTTVVDKAFSANKLDIILFLLQNAENPELLLSSFPFEQVNPTSEIFNLCMDMAYATPNKKLKDCSYCLKSDAKKRCGKCKQVYYCDGDCQKAHWRIHKDACKSS